MHKQRESVGSEVDYRNLEASLNLSSLHGQNKKMYGSNKRKSLDIYSQMACNPIQPEQTHPQEQDKLPRFNLNDLDTRARGKKSWLSLNRQVG
jgi:hypothetical protein